MKILLVTQSFPKLSETFIVNKFVGLLNRGIDVYIVCNSSSEAEWRRFPQLDRADIRRRVRVNEPVEPRWRVPLIFPLLMLRCLLFKPRKTAVYLLRGFRHFGLDILRRFYLDAQIILLEPDILHFEFGALAVGRTYLKHLLYTKMTVSFRGYDISYSGLERADYYDDVWKGIDQVHFLSQALYRQAVKRGYPELLPFEVISPAIETSLISLKVSPKSDRLQILSVGRLEWVKGYEFALQAIQHFIKQYGEDIEYRIVGDGEMFEALHFRRHQMGLESHVSFLGALSHSDVIEEMKQADIVLHAAVSEGFCNAVLEAQAMGVAVVVSDAGGLPENIEDGVTGFVVPRRDPEAMAAKLLQLANDPALRDQMGRAGRERVERYFRLEDQITAFQHFFEQTWKGINHAS